MGFTRTVVLMVYTPSRINLVDFMVFYLFYPPGLFFRIRKNYPWGSDMATSM